MEASFCTTTEFSPKSGALHILGMLGVSSRLAHAGLFRSRGPFLEVLTITGYKA